MIEDTATKSDPAAGGAQPMTSDAADPLAVMRAADIDDTLGGPRWLVESLWARAGVGILGGAPKCCKTWLALEMTLAVGGGAPCLGSFAVHDAGPVLVYMAEDPAPVVKARLSGICRHRGLDLGGLPVHLITEPALRLDRAADQARLRAAVARYSPRLLVLDPFVRLHRIDENDAGQVSAVLGYLREVQRAHDVAILVVHHARKTGAGSHAGLSLRGSGDFFAWADSLLYMRRHHGRLLLTAEHRAAPASDPIGVMLVGEQDAHLELDPEGEELPSSDADDALPLEQIVVDVLTAAEAPLTRTELRARVKVRNERLGQVLTRLAAACTIRRLGDRWAVPDSRSRSP
jgi:hypothetical protein